MIEINTTYNFNITEFDDRGDLINNTRFRAVILNGCDRWHVYDVENKFLFELPVGIGSVENLKVKAREYLKDING